MDGCRRVHQRLRHLLRCAQRLARQQPRGHEQAHKCFASLPVGLAPHTVMHATPPFLSLDVFEVLEVVVHVHHVLLRALVTPVLLATCRTSLATRRTSLGAIRRQSRLPLALASGFRER